MAKGKNKKKQVAKKKAKKPVVSASTSVSPASSKLGIRPTGDRVLVRPESASGEETLPSGIIIPDTARKEKPERGEVVAVGPGKRGDDNEIIPVGVRVGDTVVFSKYGYDEVTIEDTEYYIVSESNILAVVR